MTLRPLIAGQTIKNGRIDNHKSGTGEPVEWGKGIHLDKTINDKKGKWFRFKVYLDSDREIEFVDSRSDEDRRRVINEVSNVLGKNPKKRKDFVEDIIKGIDRFSQTMPSDERRKNLNAGANRIAKHFGLKEAFVIDIDKDITQCLTEHYDENSKVCYILQDLREKTITLGEDLDLVKDKKIFQ